MKKIINFILFPIRIILPNVVVGKIGLTSLQDERFNIVLSYIQGTLLDVGCGEGNKLVKKYNNVRKKPGIGVDVFHWDEVDKVCDTTALPFPEASFDTVTIVASLNHILEKEKVLNECYRVLKNEGILIITMINPIIGYIRHKLSFWWDKDQILRGINKDESYGMWAQEIRKLLKLAGFHGVLEKCFLYGLNNLYIYKK